ncbi:unnamed protein product [Lupinus luteus]|uniref:Protein DETOXIFICATION n=1 Tax=Lupinus luteus TaxID=3873 RepID=A0AAV1WYG5_LUPLU
MSSDETSAFGEANVLLFDEDTDGEKEKVGLLGRVWVESKKLWHIAGPAIFNRVCNCTMIIITQAFAGHLGDLELAATSIAVNVILGLDLGLMPKEIAELAGVISIWLIPTHLAFALFFPLHFFLQSQLKNKVIAWVSFVTLVFHASISLLVLYKFELGVICVVAAVNVSWWIMVLGYFGYIVCGNCPSTWTGFSLQAFSGLWEFTTLSVASGVMICLEVWYDKVLMLMTGVLHNAKTSVEALTICLSINIWQMMFPLSFLAAVGVRVANELGAGNGKGAKFATKVAVMTSFIISVFFWLLIMNFRNKFAYMFSSSEVVIEEVNKLSPLLGFTILLNSVQPVLSGVAVGSGWQKYVAYINLGCYYGIGLPLGYLLGFVFNLGVEGIWAGLIFGGTAIQTLILIVITIRCDWDKEAEKARLHVRKWEGSNKRIKE